MFLLQQEKYRRLEAAAKADSEQKRQGFGKGKGTAIRGKLPEPPKTAEEIWQQNVIGDYLAKYRVCTGVVEREEETTL